MCSIAGIIGFAAPAAAAAVAGAMNQAQRHRGPDEGGLWCGEGAVLAHRRLSIIDLAGGHQPMTNEDGSHHLVFNGEIYNHAFLRKELQQKGHIFQCRCDTEVLLHLYEEEEESFVRKLDGMFAFALWDAPRKKLILGRDRAGQKPLYYFVKDRMLVFASELGALRLHPDFPAEPDPEAVSDYLSLQYVPGDRTVYKGVRKLVPGSVMTFFPDTGERNSCIYWQTDFRIKTSLDFRDAAEELRHLVTEAVRKRLMSDVPFGVFLSGGVDSAVIAAVMTRLRMPQETMAFTMGFGDPLYDERSAAKISASWISGRTGGALKQFERNVPACSFEELTGLLKHFGEPYADASFLPTAILSRFAREKIIMALSGDGADELFAGYERYLAMRLVRMTGFLPESVRQIFFPMLEARIPDAGERTRTGRLRRLCRMLREPRDRQYFSILDRFPAELRNRLAGERLKNTADPARNFNFRHTAKDLAEQCMETDFRQYLEGDILPKMDRMSMAASLEVRNPFLDTEVVEFASSLPLEFKLCGTCRKHILTEAFRDDLAPEIRTGKKRGFGIPLGSWLCGPWKEPAAAVLFDGPLVRSGWVRRDGLEEVWQEHQQGIRDHRYILFNLTALGLSGLD